MPQNRLAAETSPYLQQHADNPVDWHAWNSESLELARECNKPILLSIGYSACHWCHVMAHESFEDEETAKLMNQLFVNIKVDREERPDLDKIYQTAHYMLTQRNGGWPLTMFLTPDDQMPFFGGTYFPKTAHYGLPGFKDLLQHIAEAYRDKEADIRQQNQSIQDSLGQIFSTQSTNQLPSRNVLTRAYEQLVQSFDPRHGGFGKAPKFPHPTNIELLLHLADGQLLEKDAITQAATMAFFSLEKMAAGGIYDQVGGGFCRYSVDDLWMIPHFEKMLYDNGPLLSLYAQGYSLTQQRQYQTITRETADWVIREMQSPEGGYYSSQDADSEGEEGKFYVWSPEEIKKHLTSEEYAVVSRHLGLDRDANFEGQWHLHGYVPQEQVASELNLDSVTAEALLSSAKQTLYQVRSQRVWPGRDEKILLSWNALMIKGMLNAAQHTQTPGYTDSARRSLDFIRTTLWKDGRLLATYKDGKAHLNAYLDDYAFLLDALISMLQVEWDNALLDWAIEIADSLLAKFEDSEHGGFFFTSSDHEELIQRPRTLADEAMPSGYAIATQSLQRLGWLLGEQRYLVAAERSLKAAAKSLKQSPSAYASLLIALDEHINPPELFILRGTKEAMSDWQAVILRQYRPGRLCFAIDSKLSGLPEALQGKTPRGDCVAYRCHGTTCSPPIEKVDQLTTGLN